MKTSKLLGIVIALQVLLLIGQWVAPSASVARADVPLSNPSERQLAMVDELKTLTDQLDLRSGRKHLEATQNSMNRLTAVMDQLSKEFQEMKRSDPALTRQALLNSPAGPTTR